MCIWCDISHLKISQTVYADGVNILSENTKTINRNKETQVKGNLGGYSRNLSI
jgi:hypothetical protein